MEERLRLCCRALMMYSVWHPEFKGFDKEHLGVDLAGAGGGGANGGPPSDEATRDLEPTA